VVAFVLAFRGAEKSVEIGPVGTVAEWRGRGLSTRLMSTVLNECRRAGIEAITLTVDGDSPTSAHRLYERLGFRVTSSLLALHKPIRS